MEFTRINVEQAEELIKTNPVTIVDIRNADAFLKSHIPGAHHINDQNVDDFIKEADKTNPLICYCYHGFSSQNAATFFIDQGFKQVYSVDGGYEEWKNKYEH